MKTLIIIIVCCVPFITGNLVKLDIYLNFDECVNCYISLSQINKIKKCIPVTFYVNNEDSLVAKEFLEEYGLNVLDIKYIPLQKMDNICKLSINNVELENFPIKDLYQKIALINRISE